MSKSIFPIRKRTTIFAPSTNSNVITEQGPSKTEKKIMIIEEKIINCH
jgi:hypothetical protein